MAPTGRFALWRKMLTSPDPLYIAFGRPLAFSRIASAPLNCLLTRFPGFVKDRSCSEGRLVFTSLALIQIAGAMKRGLIMATTGASVTLGPSKVEKMLLACFFSSKLLLELNQVYRGLLHCYSSFTVSIIRSSKTGARSIPDFVRSKNLTVQ